MSENSDLTEAAGKPAIAFNSARFLTSASKRNECPEDSGAEVAFAGRSNAGKSSALNTITLNGKLARTSKTPGRTRLINFFSLSTAECRLVDLPGYGYAKVSRDMKTDWQKHLDDYLVNRTCLRGLTLVMDIRHPLTPFDQMMSDWCGHNGLALMILLTKADKLKNGPARQTALDVRKALRDHPTLAGVVPFSSLKKTGVDQARLQLTQWLTGEPQA